MRVEHRYTALEPARFSATVQAWKERFPAMGLLAMLPEQEKAAVPWIQQTCRALGVPLMGAIFPALLRDDGFSVEGAWLVCFAHCPEHLLQPSLDAAGQQALQQWTRQVVPADAPRPTVFFVFDAMVPHIGSVMDELHLALDCYPHYAGASAGSETFAPMPCLFDGERWVGDGVLAINLGAEVATALCHAYPVAKTLMRATAAQGNRIIQIDGRPAFEVYQQVIAQEYGVTLTRENFYDYAVHFPFGVITVVDVLVRIPVALGDDLSLLCVGEIAPNAALRLLRAPRLDDNECMQELVTALGPDLHQANAAGLGLLTFYCAGRRMHFLEQAAAELSQLHRCSGAPYLLGALSLGEIHSMQELEAPRFHNAALVCVATP